MIGSMISLGGYFLVLFILVIWMVVKIAKESPLLAVVTFFFWPAAVLAMGRGVRDITIPFALAVVTSGAIWWASNRVVDKAIEEVAVYYSPAEIEEIRRDNPEVAAQIEAEQARQFAEGDSGDSVDDAANRAAEDAVAQALGRGESAAYATPAKTPAELKALEQEAGAEKRARLRESVAGLEPRRGTIRFERAGAVLALPVHFRYVPRDQLDRIAELHNEPLTRNTLGWITHERVNLGADRIWFVEVSMVRVDPATMASNDGSKIDFSSISATTPVPGGELRYVYHGPDSVPVELGRRATRLMVANTSVQKKK
jgi:hypothetical protein